MNSKLKHAEALRNNRAKCKAYRDNDTRAENKARKQARIERRLEQARLKRLAKAEKANKEEI